MRIKSAIIGEMEKNPVLVEEHGVHVNLMDSDYFGHAADHYRRAYERGDFFGSRYSDPSSTIFNPGWFEKEAGNPEHVWIVFSRNGRLLGTTGLFCENGYVSIDETQIDEPGRGMKIMNHYFRRFVPVLYGLDADVSTEFVLTPQSKNLRAILQGELGMPALGVHPHNLFHPKKNFTRSEVSSIRYSSLKPMQVSILPEFKELYGLVQNQLALPDPDIIDAKPSRKPRFSERYMEISVSAEDPHRQGEALGEGYRPVKYDPKKNIFYMAMFPPAKPDLSFLFSENIPSNMRLVHYLDSRLYSGD